MRRITTTLVLLASLIGSTRCVEAGSGAELLKLVPQDAGVTLVVEDLRGHAQAFFQSPLAEGFFKLPVVRDWAASDGSRRYEMARNEVEAALGVNLKTIRDDILGDAFLLSIHAVPGVDPRSPSGLLLARPRNRALLDRLIGVLNSAEMASGDLAEVIRRDRNGKPTYYHRRFRDGAKADNWYGYVGESTFAWSNSESLLRGVLDRDVSKGPGLDARPEARKVRAGLPENAAATILVDPKFVARLAEIDSKSGAAPGRLRLYLRAIRYFGAALEWKGGLLSAHLHAVYDPSLVPEPHRRWAAARYGSSPASMPADALGIAAIPVDLAAFADLILDPAEGEDRAKAENMRVAIDGLFGRDLRREILPKLGPETRLLIRNPGKVGGALPIAISAPRNDAGSSEVVRSIENGLRTTLAFIALGPDRQGNGGVVETIDLDKVRLTTISGPPPNLSFSVDRGRVTLGNSPGAVAWALNRGLGGAPPSQGFERDRAAYFAESAGFVYLDIDAWTTWATTHKPAIVRWLARGRGPKEQPPLPTEGLDFENSLAICRLFRAAFATCSVSGGFEEAHLRLGLIARGIEK